MPGESSAQPNPSDGGLTTPLRPLGYIQWYAIPDSGYNLMLNGTKNDHIKVSEKYEVI